MGLVGITHPAHLGSCVHGTSPEHTSIALMHALVFSQAQEISAGVPTTHTLPSSLGLPCPAEKKLEVYQSIADLTVGSRTGCVQVWCQMRVRGMAEERKGAGA